MRLIDADKIMYTDISDGQVPNGVWITFIDRINGMPTVEAIPIEWIRQWVEENYELECDYAIEQMLDDWRAECEK